MKSRQLRIGLMFLAMFAFLMIVLLRFVGGSKPAPQAMPEQNKLDTVEVLVARTDIGMGQLATQANFRWQSWPADAVSESFVTRSRGGDAELAGSIVRSPILAGEPITAGKLVKAGQGGVLAAILPKGMRAISTRIKEETAAARLILPNDRVDVILIRRLQNKGGGGGETFVSDTLYRNVRVLAMGQQIDAKDGKKADNGANTATLELTPVQAEQLALANSLGEISLTLRPITDLLSDGSESQPGLVKERKNSVKVMKYGQSSRAYGVN
ncbi:MAG: Flp pilus assembly protein CpaB [Hyphomicrobiaceae bacterium]|nr:Flp pilus assembly protein CpaB [Hyphomicrobiaceae bacterium]